MDKQEAKKKGFDEKDVNFLPEDVVIEYGDFENADGDTDINLN